MFVYVISVRGNKNNTKGVKLDESVIKTLCLKATAIFMSQPMLLELEAPIKICGKYFGPQYCK